MAWMGPQMYSCTLATSSPFAPTARTTGGMRASPSVRQAHPYCYPLHHHLVRRCRCHPHLRYLHRRNHHRPRLFQRHRCACVSTHARSGVTLSAMMVAKALHMRRALRAPTAPTAALVLRATAACCLQYVRPRHRHRHRHRPVLAAGVALPDAVSHHHHLIHHHRRHKRYGPSPRQTRHRRRPTRRRPHSRIGPL